MNDYFLPLAELAREIALAFGTTANILSPTTWLVVLAASLSLLVFSTLAVCVAVFGDEETEGKAVGDPNFGT